MFSIWWAIFLGNDTVKASVPSERHAPGLTAPIERHGRTKRGHSHRFLRPRAFPLRRPHPNPHFSLLSPPAPPLCASARACHASLPQRPLCATAGKLRLPSSAPSMPRRPASYASLPPSAPPWAPCHRSGGDDDDFPASQVALSLSCSLSLAFWRGRWDPYLDLSLFLLPHPSDLSSPFSLDLSSPPPSSSYSSSGSLSKGCGSA